MSHILVENEGDMEFGLGFAYGLAMAKFNDRKKLEITFPSEGLMEIFLDNLFKEFITLRVPDNHGLNIVIHIPEGNQYE
jgi:hypothetical protein